MFYCTLTVCTIAVFVTWCFQVEDVECTPGNDHRERQYSLNTGSQQFIKKYYRPGCSRYFGLGVTIKMEKLHMNTHLCMYMYLLVDVLIGPC